MKILIIDNDDRFRQFLIVTLENLLGEIDVIEATNFRVAKMIFESDPYFECIISSLDLDSSFMDIWQHFKDQEYNIPFVLYSKDKTDLTFPQTPVLIKDPESDFCNFKNEFSNLELFQKKSKPTEIHDGYKQVRLFFFWRFSYVDYPLFLKLGEDKYVKILNEKEKYGPDFLQKYQDKGRVYFFVREKDYAQFTKDLLTKPLIELDDSLDSEEKNIRTHQFLQQMVQSVGITPDVVSTAEESIQTVIKETKKKKSLGKLMSILEKAGRYNSDHSTLLCYITSAMCDELDWNTRRSKEKLAFAALFHDVTLLDSRLAVINYRLMSALDKFKKEAKEKFLSHPTKAAEMMVEISSSYPQVDSIIATHHERPDGTGFPYGKDYNQLNPLQSLFIVAHDFVSRVYERNFDLTHPQEIIDEMLPEYRLGHFSRCLMALQSIIVKNFPH